MARPEFVLPLIHFMRSLPDESVFTKVDASSLTLCLFAHLQQSGNPAVWIGVVPNRSPVSTTGGVKIIEVNGTLLHEMQPVDLFAHRLRQVPEVCHVGTACVVCGVV